ncbi:MAG: hypothetical protein HJJLKODD_00252 [Phycisphaerae bacterium]|nr:hypothetical protein [Phycisphaerae bacterium]
MNELWERLLNRYLDGELTSGEQAEFEQLLLAEPVRRTELEQYQRWDRLAGEWVAEQITVSSTTQSPVTQRRLRMWMVWPTALAACLVMMVTWPEHHLPTQLITRHQPAQQLSHAGNPTPSGEQPEIGFAVRQPAISVGEQQRTNVDYLGVWDEATNQFYLLEQRRTQKTRPAPNNSAAGQNSGMRLASGEM